MHVHVNLDLHLHIKMYMCVCGFICKHRYTYPFVSRIPIVVSMNTASDQPESKQEHPEVITVYMEVSPPIHVCKP